MTKVKSVDPRNGVKEVEKKPIEFTHWLNPDAGWKKAENKPEDYSYVSYLGECNMYGHLFAAYNKYGCIYLYKGNYNSGKIK